MRKLAADRIKLYCISFTLFLLFSNVLHAQTVRLQVAIKTSHADILENATIQLLGLPDTLLLQTQVSKRPYNTFQVKPFRSYLIKVSAIGFQTLVQVVPVQREIVTIALELKEKRNLLKEVTIVSKKPLLKQEDDKTIVEADVLAGGSTNAYEVLEKTPGIIVDQDGKIYLSSTTPATVYINGRDIKMSANDIASFLKNLPSGSISKIELLRTPSARYDAADSGGIVNIVLKKGIVLGTTGNVNVRYDQGTYGTGTAGFSVNNSTGKLRSYLSYQYTNRRSYERITSNRFINSDTLLAQQSFTRFNAHTNFISGGVDVACSKRINITYDVQLTGTQNNNQATSANDFSDTLISYKYLQSQTPIYNKGNTFIAANTVSIIYRIDTLGSEWATEANYTYSKNSNAQRYTTMYSFPQAPDLSGNGDLKNRGDVVNIKSDVSLKLRHGFNLEAGIKSGFAFNKNAALYFIKEGNSPEQADTFQTIAFRYNERISSAYAQLSKNMFGFVVKAGLRFENTDISGHQTVPANAFFEIKRNDIFPYLYLKRRLFTILGYPLTGNIVYRRSITRPNYDELNPAPRYVDQYTYDVGNRQLQPQFTNNYEINATYDDFPVFAVGVNNTQDVFSMVTYKNTNSPIVFRTYDNLGRFREIYGRLFGGLPPGHRYFMYAGVQCNYIQYSGYYQHQPLNYNRASYTFYTGHSLKATPTLNLFVNAWMLANGFRGFNELGTMGQINVSITKTMLDKRLSVVLSGNDILKTNRSAFYLHQANLFVNGTRVQDSRRFGITIRYAFGTIHEEKASSFNQVEDPVK
jgi:iron complex outermembrane recepter protein